MSAMRTKEGFQSHWLDIDAERMARYETMFRWDPKSAHYFAGARIGPGQTIADFGCGPGDTVIEFARRVGARGHVHALDINREFLHLADAKAKAGGLKDSVSTHLLTSSALPLADESLDRVIARDAIVYVDDPAATWREFYRVLRPGGLAHVIEGDWQMLSIEPIDGNDWQKVMQAAAAWPHPTIGRQLHRHARRAGFQDIGVEVLTQPDLDGRLMGVIQNILKYARAAVTPEPELLDRVMSTIDAALSDRTYLAIAPKFVVTAVR